MENQQKELSTVASSMSQRETSEVQGQVLMAKKFPRDIIKALDNIVAACSRKRLAENAIYSYPRGGTQIEGPSIRLAETIARYWGNLDFGIIELENKGSESVMMAYAWDVETNTRSRQVFTVKHERYSKARGNEKLTDQRDVYEMAANMAARRLRARILSLIPGDIIDEALEVCNKTLAGQTDKPLIDRIRSMVDAFKGVGVTQKQIETRMQKDSTAITEHELISLRKIYKSLSDGMSKVEDWFDFEKPSLKKPEKPSEDRKPKKLSKNQEKLKSLFEDKEYEEAVNSAISEGTLAKKDPSEYPNEETVEAIATIEKFKGFIDSARAGV